MEGVAEREERKRCELVTAMNGREHPSNTPDFILAQGLEGMLEVLHATIQRRDEWYAVVLQPGQDRCLSCGGTGRAHPAHPPERSTDAVEALAWDMQRAAGAFMDRGLGTLYVDLARYVLERFVPKANFDPVATAVAGDADREELADAFERAAKRLRTSTIHRDPLLARVEALERRAQARDEISLMPVEAPR